LGGTGVCVSNLPVWEGRPWFSYPFEPGAPGHEGYGTVESTGKGVNGIVKGDRVALLSYHAYAQYDKTHISNVVKLPDSFNGKLFLGEPLACAVNIMRRSAIQENQTVVVIGAGFIGCLLIQLLKHAGAEVIAVSRRESSLKFAEMSGAHHLVRFNEVWRTKDEIFKLAPRGIQRVIEATGVQSGLELATEIISEYGMLIIAGYHQDGIRNINMQQWNWKAIDVINAHERDPKRYISGLKDAIQLAEKGILKPEELITHRFDFRDINKAFDVLEQKPEGFLKGVIVFS
jgi:threonine dehydrogenase-like Zn-dependent dehydrogenase